MICLSEWKNIPVRFHPAKTKNVPFCMVHECRLKRRVQRNSSSFACFRLASAESEESLVEVNMAPAGQVLLLVLPEVPVEYAGRAGAAVDDFRRQD